MTQILILAKATKKLVRRVFCNFHEDPVPVHQSLRWRMGKDSLNREGNLTHIFEGGFKPPLFSLGLLYYPGYNHQLVGEIKLKV